MKTASRNEERQYAAALRLIFALSFLLAGLYYELAASVSSLALMGLLLWRRKACGALTFRWNAAMVAVGLVWLFYLLTALWGVDSGLALWGAVKYLPLPLFGLCLLQTKSEVRVDLLASIPWLGGAMTLLTFGLQYVPVLQSAFSVNGRLAGFFQYPNTFACFLLLGIVILLLGKTTCRTAWLPLVCGAVLLCGLILAGSRTVYLLTLPAVAACLVFRRSGKLLLSTLIVCALGVLLSLVGSWLGGVVAAERIASISTNASTFLGRLLYWKDALPVIARHPFGLGYLGYYITQGSFQTGVYSVRWVHNDLLQLLLDVGWIPVAAAVAAVVRGVVSQNSTAVCRMVILLLLAHCMMDFDLEFISMYFVLLLCLDWESGRACRISPPGGACLLLASVTGVAGLYIGMTSSLSYAGQNGAAAALYPWNTLANIELLAQTADTEELEALAEQILKQDDSVALAWDAKALVAYSRGDFGTYIIAKRQAISLNRYSIEEYEDYFEKLAIGVELYARAGDGSSAQICLEEIQEIQAMLDDLETQTDPLAWRLADTPDFAMPEEYYAYLEEIAEMENLIVESTST